MAASPSPDHLFGLRNSFYIGAYHAAITSSQSLPAHALSPDDLVERDALLYRSYIAIGSHQVRACPPAVPRTPLLNSHLTDPASWCRACMQLVIGEIGPSAATPLQAVKLLAVYLSGDAGNRVGPVLHLQPMRFPRVLFCPSELPLV
jgi:coatomer protein complex subunit epsilon